MRAFTAFSALDSPMDTIFCSCESLMSSMPGLRKYRSGHFLRLAGGGAPASSPSARRLFASRFASLAPGSSLAHVFLSPARMPAKAATASARSTLPATSTRFMGPARMRSSAASSLASSCAGSGARVRRSALMSNLTSCRPFSYATAQRRAFAGHVPRAAMRKACVRARHSRMQSAGANARFAMRRNPRAASNASVARASPAKCASGSGSLSRAQRYRPRRSSSYCSAAVPTGRGSASRPTSTTNVAASSSRRSAGVHSYMCSASFLARYASARAPSPSRWSPRSRRKRPRSSASSSAAAGRASKVLARYTPSSAMRAHTCSARRTSSRGVRGRCGRSSTCGSDA
mmetsp:Transcript_12790/g.37534  ORF Transcript_12790/g.37534 Transcript_12790/m.37534 type:complete len:345 (-) Transcript_12790:1319-2353(-)